jgi:hypothetical protein
MHLIIPPVNPDITAEFPDSKLNVVAHDGKNLVARRLNKSGDPKAKMLYNNVLELTCRPCSIKIGEIEFPVTTPNARIIFRASSIMDANGKFPSNPNTIAKKLLGRNAPHFFPLKSHQNCENLP